MSLRVLALSISFTLVACGRHDEAPRSLVGDFAAPGTYALAGDTLTVWKRVRLPDGAWRFQSYSITPGGTVDYLDEPERVEAPENPEDAQDLAEHREGFTLQHGEFEAIRSQAALLRP